MVVLHDSIRIKASVNTLRRNVLNKAFNLTVNLVLKQVKLIATQQFETYHATALKCNRSGLVTTLDFFGDFILRVVLGLPSNQAVQRNNHTWLSFLETVIVFFVATGLSEFIQVETASATGLSFFQFSVLSDVRVALCASARTSVVVIVVLKLIV